jgi:hypothetical protein
MVIVLCFVRIIATIAGHYKFMDKIVLGVLLKIENMTLANKLIIALYF